MCPIVPTFTCGFERSNFSFAISLLLIFRARRHTARTLVELLTLAYLP
jgi:hypothetical protein